MRRFLWLVVTLTPVLTLAADLRVGVGKVDVTPTTAIRLTGYAARKTESEGVEHRLFARAMAIGTGKDDAAVLVALETMAMPRELVDDVAARLTRKAGVPRERFAVCATHTHAAPMLNGAAPNIFGQPVPADQQAHVDQYTTEVADKLEQVALAAFADMKPATVTIARGSVGFAANRRGRLAADLPGPVDHELPVLIAMGADGKVRAVVANYACHCTTGGPDVNKVHGDWAGFASENIEAAYPGAVAMVTIGCGADANPAPRSTLDLARRHGAALANEVARLVKQGPAKALSAAPVGQINVIEAAYDKLPTKAELEKLAEKDTAPGYNAKVQLARLAKDGRLAESLPYTIQTWRFGDDLAMVFLAGEVVVDYALRFKHDFDPARLWVTSYANDVCCYIPSRRILAEGGYEAEGAMVYYARPTKFAPAIENDIVRAVHSLLPISFRSEKSLKEFPPAKTPEESKQCIKVDGDLRVEIVAAEPLVQSPVAIDWDLKGRLWVLEMYDYPSGLHDDNRPGGRVVVLESTRNDGRYDKRTTFLDNLPYPQGLMCWRSGVLVCAAPDIIYAADDDDDGKADSKKLLFSGFNPDNQQWEVNGLAWGLDNWVYGASSIRNDPIRLGEGGKTLDLGGRDFRMNPDTGAFEPAAGRTQFCRTRDDFGNWFGNDNSTPLFHYPLEERYVRRNPHVAYPPPRVMVAAGDKDPTRLYPISPLLERFNNPESANRVTSACGPSVYRDSLLFGERADQEIDAFFCEPVHDLVRRLVLSPKGATFAAHRVPADGREFLASTDNWFRPVQTRTGPDGALWVVDMYRFVIEHPRWITAERLRTLDTRAGHDKGRIYRVLPKDAQPRPIEDLSRLSVAQLAAMIDHPNGTVRDLIHRELVHRNDKAAIEPLRTVAKRGATPAARAQALCALVALNPLEADAVAAALGDADPGVRRQAVRAAEQLLGGAPRLVDQLLRMTVDPDAAVCYQLALALGEADASAIPAALAGLLGRSPDDPWMRAAVLSAAVKRPLELLERLRTSNSDVASVSSQLAIVIAATAEPDRVAKALDLVLPKDATVATPADLDLAATLLDALDRRRPPPPTAIARLDAVIAQARAIAQADDATRADDERFVAALALLGRKPSDADADLAIAAKQLAARSAPRVQTAALAVLKRSKGPRAADCLVTALPQASPALRAQILDTLVSRPKSVEALLTAIDARAITPADVPPATRDRLLKHPDPALRDRARKSFTTAPSPTRAKAIADFQAALKLPGDPARGRPIFERVCASCHALGGVGHTVGPDLAALTDRSTAFLLASIVDPNAAIDGRFIAYQLDTADGDTHVGLLADETAATVTLVQPNGLRPSIPRREIKSLTATKLSLMPEGLEQGLAPQDMADLIAFVQRPAAR